MEYYSKYLEQLAKAKAKRRKEMMKLWERGFTLQEIGETAGISRERVRQILGPNRTFGGISKRAAVRLQSYETRMQKNRDSYCMKTYGMSSDELKKYKGSGKDWWKAPFGKYIRQRQNARLRAIPWKLNFKEWIEIWEASGKFDLRGRGNGYAMCRTNDQGAYEVGNVRIATNSENIKEAIKVARTSGKKWGREFKTHCKRGHLLKGDNIKFNARGDRWCVICASIRNKEQYKTKKAARKQKENSK